MLSTSASSPCSSSSRRIMSHDSYIFTKRCRIITSPPSASTDSGKARSSSSSPSSSTHDATRMRLSSRFHPLTISVIAISILIKSASSSSYVSLLPPIVKSDLIPCDDLFRPLSTLPCLCTRPDIPSSDPTVNGTVQVVCDGVSFFGDNFPSLPFRGRISGFNQRGSYIQSLEPQLFTASAIPLIRVDFSRNHLRRLHERIFDGIEGSLREVDLSANLLGDQLNPIFSTNEFLHLKNLLSLSLAGNYLKALDNNLLKGCRNLTNFDLAANDLSFVPVGALNGLFQLKWLNLGENKIREIRDNSFPPNMDSLTHLNLSSNKIERIKDGSFSTMDNLKELILSSNLIKDFSGQALVGLRNLEVLDLSDNFLEFIPSEALSGVRKLKRINLSSNNIISIDERSFSELSTLESIDLSRNNIKSIASSDSFAGLTGLKFLNLAYNKLKSVDELDETFLASMSRLEVIDLTDNEILNFPTRLLVGCPRLKKVFLDYNLIGQLTADHLSTVLEVDELSLSYNLITELPDDLFSNLKNLRLLNIHGNKIDQLTQAKFNGIPDLLGLDIGYNDLIEIPKLVLPKLMILNMAMNQFTHIAPAEDPFKGYPSLRYLNMSSNQLSYLPPGVFDGNVHLEVVDLTDNKLDRLSQGVFKGLNMTSILMSRNEVKELTTNTFSEMKRLKNIDLSYNEISLVKNGAFDNLVNLRNLDLSHNKLTSFKGDFFSTRTRLEILDVSDNQISYLYPNSFNIHRRLKRLNLADNRLTFFPTEIISSSRLIESINLKGNRLTSLESADFSNLPNLRHLDLSRNDINFLPANSFGNSSQLSSINLSHNRISSIADTAFRGIARLTLDMSHNDLTNIPIEVFNRRNVFSLVSLNIGHNNFSTFPSTSLRRQYSTLEELNISHNKISILPASSDVLVNVKSLDISHNPLSTETIVSFFSEPKSVRNLNASGLTITQVIMDRLTIEFPFLRTLNMSYNAISSLSPSTFDKTYVLDTLDLSHNKLTRLNLNGPIGSSGQMMSVWKKFPNLRRLVLSSNPVQNVLKGDFESLVKVTYLDLSNLTTMTHFECESLQVFNHLEGLVLSGYPNLDRIDVQECLTYLNLKSLKTLSIEFKEPSIQGHLQRLLYYSKVNDLTITGKSLTSISASAFAGLKSEEVTIRLIDTRIKEIPDTIFANFLLTTKVTLDLSRNEISTISSSLIQSLDNKLMTIRIYGLESNQFVCDCRAEPFWKWMNLRVKLSPNVQYYNSFVNHEDVTCALPMTLHGVKMADLEADQLACIVNMPTTSTAPTPSTTSAPVIIVGPKRTSPPFNKVRVDSNDFYDNKLRRLETVSRKNGQSGSNLINSRTQVGGTDAKNVKDKPTTHLTRVDTMIIGIIAGIIAFIVILVLIICVMKVRSNLSVSSSRGGVMAAHIAHSIMSQPPPVKSCTCATYPGHVCQACSLHAIYGLPRQPPVATRPMSVYPIGNRTTGPMRPSVQRSVLHTVNGSRRTSGGSQGGINKGYGHQNNYLYSDIPDENFK